MKQILAKYTDRIDAMTLRERTAIFIGVVVVLVALFQNSLLEPISARQKSLAAQIAQQTNEMNMMQTQVIALVQPKKQDEDTLKRDRIKAMRGQLAELDRQIDEKQKKFVAPEKIAAMLENMLKKNEQLQLLSLQNLPATSLTGTPAAPAAPAAGSGKSEIYRHSVQLIIRGTYFDLLNYLVALERMKEQVFWAGVELTAQYPQSVMTLTIYTLSLEKSWLTV